MSDDKVWPTPAFDRLYDHATKHRWRVRVRLPKRGPLVTIQRGITEVAFAQDAGDIEKQSEALLRLLGVNKEKKRK